MVRKNKSKIDWGAYIVTGVAIIGFILLLLEILVVI